MLKRNHPCVSAKAVTIEKNSMSRQKSLLCIDTIWSCKVAAKILLFIETKITERLNERRGSHFKFSFYSWLDQGRHKVQSQLVFFPSWRTRPTLSYVQVCEKSTCIWDKLRLLKYQPLYSIVQQQCLLAAQLHYLQAYLTASQHQQQQQFAAVGSLSQHVERGGKEFPSDGRVVLPPGGENQESPRSNVNAVSVPYTLLSQSD